jgi:outer membrane immunogenic protein
MKRVSTAVAGLFASMLSWGTAAAIETNISPQPSGWNGFYLGVTAGHVRGTTSWTDGIFLNSGDFSDSGTTIGLTFGRNWQVGRWVYGFEGDLSRSTLRVISDIGCFPVDCQTSLEWFGTFRGRLGYLLTPGLLVYGTAGVSVGKFRHAVQGTQTNSTAEAGWVVGAGIEKVLLQRWTLKAEYIFMDTDSGEACPASLCIFGVQSKFDTHIFRFGLNHHFGSFGASPAMPSRAPGWSGFYASVVLGYGRGETEWSDPFFGTTSGEFDGKGPTLGFGAGYNWQVARWVFGFEGDAAFSWIKTSSFTPFCLCFSAETEIANLFTARGRAGYLVTPNTLLFVTGGVAVASLRFGNPNQGTASAVEFGPTVGAGIETQIIKDWTIKTEYLFASFGSSEACGFFICFGQLNSDYVRVHTMRFALNRYF